MRMDEDWGFWFAGAGFMISVSVFIYCVVGILMHLSFPGQLAAIEQLRKDAESVTAIMSEDVIGQVTSTNQWLASCKQYNRLWWSDPLHPDECDDVPFIDMPSAKE